MPALFDDLRRDYLVIVNEERQHSLWPAAVAVPEGWTLARGPASQDDCLSYVREHWADIRPASVSKASPDHSGEPGER